MITNNGLLSVTSFPTSATVLQPLHTKSSVLHSHSITPQTTTRTNNSSKQFSNAEQTPVHEKEITIRNPVLPKPVIKRSFANRQRDAVNNIVIKSSQKARKTLLAMLEKQQASVEKELRESVLHNRTQSPRNRNVSSFGQGSSQQRKDISWRSYIRYYILLAIRSIVMVLSGLLAGNVVSTAIPIFFFLFLMVLVLLCCVFIVKSLQY